MASSLVQALPSLPQAFTTSQTVCSFLRQKLLQIWSLKKISQSAGSTLLSQTSRKFLCRLQRGSEEAYEQNTASTYPEPEDKEAFIRTHLYDYNYDKVSYLPSVYAWPAEVQAPKNPDLKMN